MAKLQILGNSLTLTSALKAEDINRVEKLDPKALRLFEENPEGKMEEVFRVALTDGQPNFSPYGVAFDSVNKDGYAYLTAHLNRPDNIEDEKTVATESFLPVLTKLNKLEETFNAKLDEINASVQAAKDNVEVLD